MDVRRRRLAAAAYRRVHGFRNTGSERQVTFNALSLLKSIRARFLRSLLRQHCVAALPKSVSVAFRPSRRLRISYNLLLCLQMIEKHVFLNTLNEYKQKGPHSLLAACESASWICHWVLLTGDWTCYRVCVLCVNALSIYLHYNPFHVLWLKSGLYIE